MNKKIALVVDVESWAFDIEANLLKEKLKDYYDIDVFVSSNCFLLILSQNHAVCKYNSARNGKNSGRAFQNKEK